VVYYEQVPRAPAFKHVNDAALEKRCALSGGDDYELLFTASQSSRAPIESVARELRLPLSRIGSIRSGASSLEVLDADGRSMSYCGGFDHFAAP
jgi:thiamine-monophosphate kinase